MQIDTTTFVLEMINFCVLVWILNRFLYRPVQKVMGRRREEIEKTLQDAAEQKLEAERLRKQYEDRFKQWEKEQNAERAALAKEITAARDKGLEQVHKAMEKQRLRLEATSAKKQADLRRQLEKRALAQGAAFAAKFLERFAGPELDSKLSEMFILDFETWSSEKTGNLTEAARETGGTILVTSAGPLTTTTREALEKMLSAKLGLACEVEYSVDETLIAGLRITIGPWVLEADVQDELGFFAGALGRNA